MSSSEIAVKDSVFHRDVQNTGSWKMSWKLPSPTQSKLESPVGDVAERERDREGERDRRPDAMM